MLSSLVSSGDMHEFVKLALEPYLFKESELKLYHLITNHIQQYGKIPSPDTIEVTPGFEDALVEAIEPPLFYLHDLEKRFLHNSLKSVLMEANSMLMDKDQGDATYQLLLNKIAELHKIKNSRHLFDFKEAADIISAEYLKQKSMGDAYGLMLGWPTLDGMSGGLRGGDFAAFIGRPAMGKTFLGLYSAMHSWKTQGTPLFISMEMGGKIIIQRLAAMYTHKPLTHLLKGELSTASSKQMMKTLNTLKAKKDQEKSFWVVDGNLTTKVDDIVMLCRQFQPSAVFVDGAYLLRHPNPKIGKFDKMTENAEWLKQKVATDLAIPVVASYQLNRDSTKKKKGGKGVASEKVGIEDIYGTDAIGQLSSLVIGLFDDDDNPEALVRRKVEILKGRNGETGQFYINWLFNSMNFDEIAPPSEGEAEDLQYSA